MQGSHSRTGSSLNPANSPVAKLVDIDEGANGNKVETKKKKKPRFAIDSELSGDEGGEADQTQPKRSKADVFVFEYGVVVLWGWTVEEEKRFLSTL